METVDIIADDVIVPIRNIVDFETGYILTSSGRARRLMPNVIMRVTAGELRELFWQPGGAFLLQNFIHVGNKELAAEFGVPADAIEYDWTEKDIVKCLTVDNLDVLLDALDFAPAGIVETLKDKAIELEITDLTKIKAISDKTGIDINAAIKNKHAYEETNNTNAEEKPKTRRAKSTAAATTRKRRTTTSKKATDSEAESK